VSALVLEELLSALAGIPAMPDALCRGQWALFDESNDPGAIGAAIEICNLCPEMSRCGEWLNSLRPKDRPLGVVAGRVNNSQPVGRPRKTPENTA
jgi:hypothetical protein